MTDERMNVARMTASGGKVCRRGTGFGYARFIECLCDSDLNTCKALPRFASGLLQKELNALEVLKVSSGCHFSPNSSKMHL